MEFVPCSYHGCRPVHPSGKKCPIVIWCSSTEVLLALAGQARGQQNKSSAPEEEEEDMSGLDDLLICLGQVCPAPAAQLVHAF